MNKMYIYVAEEHISFVTDQVEADEHRHLMLQMLVSLDEAFEIEVEKKHLSCQGIIINSNTYHRFESKGDYQLALLIENTSSLAQQIQSIYLKEAPYYKMPNEVAQEIGSLLKEKYHPMCSTEQYAAFRIELLSLLRLEDNRPVVLDDRIKQVIEAIRSCKEQEHSLEKLAKKVHLSKSRLSHLFKAHTGMPLSSYMVMHKLEKAMLYIFEGMSITEAAVMAGFDSPSHFAAVSKKVLGMSAREINKDSVFLKVSRY